VVGTSSSPLIDPPCWGRGCLPWFEDHEAFGINYISSSVQMLPLMKDTLCYKMESSLFYGPN